MNKDNKKMLNTLIEKLAEDFNFKVDSLSLLTNKNPSVLLRIIFKTDAK